MKSSGYLSEDTIVALGSAVGGAIAIIRVSGPTALPLLRKLAPESPDLVTPRMSYRAQIDGIDDLLFIYFKGPASFTGEDCVEFHIHGSSFIARKLLDRIFLEGARQALPGEFSFRAVRNGKMTVNQAQAVADLIEASSDGAVTLALEKLSGTQNVLIERFSEGLRTLAALGEVGIDFSDQDIEEVSLPRLKEKAAYWSRELKNLEGSFERGTRIQEGVTVAFVGLPNAGKSSFFNALLGEDRSIVSEMAGTTRDVVKEKITLKGKASHVTLKIADTAGLRETQDVIEKMGIERTLSAAKTADFIVFVVDSSKVNPGTLNAIGEQWASLGSPVARTFGVLTKVDLVSKVELGEAQRALEPLGLGRWMQTSAQTGEGINSAALGVAELCEKNVQRELGEVVLTRHEQFLAVRSAVEHLERAYGSEHIDLFASDIRQALVSLNSLIGVTEVEEVLGRVFSQFCIGK